MTQPMETCIKYGYNWKGHGLYSRIVLDLMLGMEVDGYSQAITIPVYN